MKNQKGDLKIYGSGGAPGGVFKDVVISGSGGVNGDIECNNLKISGSGDIKGSVDAVSIKVSGSGDIEGNVKAESIKVSGSGGMEGNVDVEDIILTGSGDIKGDLNCKILKIFGSADIGGNVSSDEVSIFGSGDIGGNCESEIFNANGSFGIGGLLNAGEIHIEIGGKCRVKEIGGERIEVKKSSSNVLDGILKALFMKKGELISEVIEGDDIYLEFTKADVVSGKNVYIGRGCEINKVEYMNEIKVSKECTVKEKIKLD